MPFNYTRFKSRFKFVFHQLTYMKKYILYALLLVISSCMKPNPNEDAKKNKVQAAVDRVRKELSDSLGIAFPSLNVLIQTPSDRIFVSSASEPKNTVTADTYFRFASNTKNFTATAILNMYEEGWLDYKAKIIDIIPGSKGTPYTPNAARWDIPYKNQITIEQLLQHSAGVFDVDNDPVPGYNGLTYTEYTQKADPTHQFTTDEMVKVVKENNLVYFPPGTDHHYSNTGYSILAEIIKRVYSFRSGKDKTYDDYMQDFIVGDYSPAPMNVHFPVLATDNALPDPHITSTVLSPERVEKFDKYNMSAQVGEGNGYGTMSQLNIHIRTLMKGQNVLKPATVQLMQKDLSPGDLRYALGCTLTPNLGYGHNGARIGYLSLMAYDPDHDVSVVSMIPLFDLRNGNVSFLKCYNSIIDAAYAAREALDFPGKP